MHPTSFVTVTHGLCVLSVAEEDTAWKMELIDKSAEDTFQEYADLLCGRDPARRNKFVFHLTFWKNRQAAYNDISKAIGIVYRIENAYSLNDRYNAYRGSVRLGSFKMLRISSRKTSASASQTPVAPSSVVAHDSNSTIMDKNLQLTQYNFNHWRSKISLRASSHYALVAKQPSTRNCNVTCRLFMDTKQVTVINTGHERNLTLLLYKRPRLQCSLLAVKSVCEDQRQCEKFVKILSQRRISLRNDMLANKHWGRQKHIAIGQALSPFHSNCV